MIERGVTASRRAFTRAPAAVVPAAVVPAAVVPACFRARHGYTNANSPRGRCGELASGLRGLA
jgi:hypothetical protein